MIGWPKPHGPTTFGPRRRCKDAIIFRSAKVVKATANKIGITVNKLNKILPKIVYSPINGVFIIKKT